MSTEPAKHGPKEHDADKNFRFVQLSTDHLNAWGDLCIEKPLAAKLLFFLVERMGTKNNAVICSYQTLQESLQVSRTTVANAVKHLKQNNWIAAIKVGSATAYCVNERVAWRSSRNLRKYAMFSATVIASESEQDKDFFNNYKEELKVVPFVENGERAISSDSENKNSQTQLDLN